MKSIVNREIKFCLVFGSLKRLAGGTFIRLVLMGLSSITTKSEVIFNEHRPNKEVDFFMCLYQIKVNFIVSLFGGDTFLRL